MVGRIETVLKQKIARRKLDGIDYHAPALAQPNAEAIRRYATANRRSNQKSILAQATKLSCPG
jgi:hypothetical protein